MCGIFSYKGKTYTWDEMDEAFGLIGYRGPDNTHYNTVADDVLFAFHRLSIMGTTEAGNQPMKHPQDESLTLICNGEIYNYKELAERYDFNLKTGSDCEIILHLYQKLGIERTIKELDGVFMFVLHDASSEQLFASRDPIGVRPGFIGMKEDEQFIASEAKPLVQLCETVLPFPPGTWWCSDTPKIFNNYFTHNDPIIREKDEDAICKQIRILLTNAVKKRLMAEREIGCLLSGGLDSSLITSLVSRYNNDQKLNTFSIGMPGSVDLDYAQIVADFLGTKHHQIEISEKDFLDAIETVIYNIESYDTTTVRASVGNYLVSKFIAENSNCKVIFNGDGADEVCCGYVYLKNAPNQKLFKRKAKN
ncbi:MAG: hypothetical protein CM1200mP10_23200 [Candidatus Neomarinimicrobiota bacterium]|nr:MAG: hypothetical protein CM1200mP10_23200 [Candidatus Neomarinimicrobiota bacterium]